MQELMDATNFVGLAITALNGKNYYEDEFILITRKKSDNITISIKPEVIFDVQLYEIYPVTIIKDGRIVFHQKEHIYLTNHLKILCGIGLKTHCIFNEVN